MFDCFLFDPFSTVQKGLRSAEVNISRRDVFQALIVAFMVIELYEAINLMLKTSRQKNSFRGAHGFSASEAISQILSCI